MYHLYFKALHIVGFVSWFACLFYLVRLFIYHTEALDKEDNTRKVLHEQFMLMEKRLYNFIGQPAMIITIVSGLLLLGNFNLASSPWLHAKLTLIFLLLGYHLVCGSIIKSLKKEKKKFSSAQLRIFNEIATLFLIAIVFLAVLRDTVLSIYGIGGFIGIAILLYVGVKLFKRKRN
ncbi:MAG: TIGR00701 family protein [Bacteroidetes bacterium]|nr:MAG: TIGR00701 family protein [Bacteroidota bacterium]